MPVNQISIRAFGSFISFLSVIATAQAQAQSANITIKLAPAGSFNCKTSALKGEAVLDSAGSVRAKNVVVDLRQLKTGISLRDQHTQKTLETSKYPSATLIDAIGKNGKGKGLIEIRGVRKQIEGSYEIDGDSLQAKFQVKLSDFNISDIRYMGIGVKDDAVIDVQIPVRTVDTGRKAK